MERQTEELEIDLLGLFYYLKKRIAFILAVCIACAALGFIGTKLFITPTYTAQTRMYVLNKSSETNVVSSDFTISNYMLNDYKVLITGQNVTKKVIQQLRLDMKPQELAEIITVTAPNDTRILQISVTYEDPKMAADIANAVRRVAAEQIQEIIEADAVHTVYEADVPEEKSGPSTMLNTAIVGILGRVAVVAVFTVVFVLDDAIHNEEDVERYLGLGTRGVIPMSSELGAPGSGKRKGKKPAVKRPVIAGKVPQLKK